MRLRNLILLIAIPASVISIVTVEYVTYFYAKKDILNRLQEKVISTLNLLQETVVQLSKSATGDMISYGSFEVFRRYLKYEQYDLHEEAKVARGEILDTFRRLARLRKDYMALGYANNQRNTVAFYSPHSDYVEKRLDGVELYSTNARDLFVSNVFAWRQRRIVRIAYQITEPVKMGYLFLDIDCSGLLSNLKQLYSSSEAEVYFVNREGSVFYVSSPDILELSQNLSEIAKAVTLNDGKAGSARLQMYNGKYSFSSLYPLSEFGWSMGFIIKNDLVFNPLKKLKFFGLLVIIVVSLAMFLIIGVLSRNLSTSVKDILKRISNVESKANGSISTSPSHVREFNLILEEIDRTGQRLEELQDKIVKTAHLAAVGESTAMIAHDVRRPLAGMKGLLSILSNGNVSGEEMKKLIAEIDKSITQTNEMLDDVMVFSKGTEALKRESLNVFSVINSGLVDGLRNHPCSDVSIEYDIDCVNDFGVYADGPKLVRVITNIIDNALDAMAVEKGGKVARGKIWIRTKVISGVALNEAEDLYPPVEKGKSFFLQKGRQDNMHSLRITISDDGPGIPEDILPRILDPFVTHGKKGGTGLGLAIARRVIDLHGGRIWARNRGTVVVAPLGAPDAERDTAVDRSAHDDSDRTTVQRMTGAEFVIELPAVNSVSPYNEAELIHHSRELDVFHKEEAARMKAGDTANTLEFMKINKERGRESNLLIVDDEPLFIETVRSMLGRLEQVRDHMKTVEAHNAEEALGLLSVNGFDYVIADVDLGRNKMNGYKLTKTILEKYPNTCVLIHSNKRQKEMDEKIRETASNKFMGFLPKPMTSSELLQFLACKSFEAPSYPTTGVPTGESTEARGRVKRVLVVNDDETVNLSMKFSLKSDEIQVLDATNVSDALGHLTASDVDIVFSDINLGENVPDGYDLLRKVREQSKDMPFYFMSGYSKRDMWPKAKEMGADGYFQLPVDTDEIKKIL